LEIRTKERCLLDFILSDGQDRMMETLMIKKQKAIEMFNHLTKQTNEKYEIKTKEFNKKITTPKIYLK
jgi:hypothetical protein